MGKSKRRSSSSKDKQAEQQPEQPAEHPHATVSDIACDIVEVIAEGSSSSSGTAAHGHGGGKQHPLPRSGEELDLDDIAGLDEREAARRLAADGPNELEEAKPRSMWQIVFEVLKEPMFVLLLVCIVLCFVLQDFTEGGILSLFVFFIIGITIFQERKTERTLDALRGLSAPRAVVIRSGRQVTVPGREVVRGDTVLLKEGDSVPADMVVYWTLNLVVNESLLTGESVPVRKAPASDAELDDGAGGADGTGMGVPGGEDTPYCFAGTMVAAGKGIGVVRQTGVASHLGQISKRLTELKEEKTPLQREVSRLVVIMTVIGLCVAAAVFLYYGIKRKEWLDGALAAITLAMGLLPEEFPVVLTVFMSLGAWRISRSNVLARRSTAIETLGACTVLCTDKTGTLTMNRMMVQALWDRASDHTFEFVDPADPRERVDEECHGVVEHAILSSQRDPFDPMESALWHLSRTGQVDAAHVHMEWEMIREYPLSRELLATSRVYRTREHQHSYIVAVKGAPEAVGDLCHLPPAEFDAVRAKANAFADQGLRVLGVARCLFPFGSSSSSSSSGEDGAAGMESPKTTAEEAAAKLPAIQHDYPFEFIGLVAFVDPIRPAVPDAIQQAYRAGIRVVMITGDYPGTARAIGEKIGLRPLGPGHIVTGEQLTAMDDAELRARAQHTTIFARVVPEQKLRIVQAYKALGEIVAMTGDGVNDAPALKAARIGVAMGQRGTDVAREAAHLVLLDDDFSSIVRAVRLGRRIYDNIQKAMAYIIAIHVPLAGVVLFPVLLGWEPIFRAVHIVFLEMVIDPACSVILEAEGEEPDVMDRPPRDTRRSMVSLPTFLVALLQGAAILAAAMLAFYYAQVAADWSIPQARALSFGLVICANICLILEDRSWELWIGRVLQRENQALWIVFAIVFPVLFLALFTPGVNRLFDFAKMNALGVPIFLAAGIVCTLWFELLKPIRRWYNRRAARISQKRLASVNALELDDVPSSTIV